MNYNRQEFVDEKTVLKAEMLEHIEDGILDCEKDNFLLQCGKSFSSNLYKKEALRANPLDAIEGFINEKSFVKISSKAPSMSDFSNGFSLSFDAPLGLGDDFFSYMFSFYKDILPEALAGIAVGLSANLGGATLPITLESPSAEVFPSISDYLPLILKTDEEFENCYFLGLFGDDDESGIPLLLFVTEDTFVGGTEKLEKGVYLITFFISLLGLGVTLYITDFSFEDKKEKEEEQPIIQVYLGESLYWDGNTNGTITKTSSAKEDDIYMKIELCKLSNTFPTLEQLQKGYWGTIKLRTSENGVSAEATEGFNISQENFNKSVYFLEDGKAILLKTFDEILGICIVFETCELNLDGFLFGQINPGFYGLKIHFSNDTSAIETRIETFSVQDFFNWTPTVVPKFQENLDVVYMSTKKNDKYIYRTPNTKDKTNRVTTEELFNKQLIKGKLPLISLLPLGMFSSIGVDMNTKGTDEETGEPLTFYRLTILLPGEEKTTYLYTAEYPEE